MLGLRINESQRVLEIFEGNQEKRLWTPVDLSLIGTLSKDDDDDDRENLDKKNEFAFFQT